MTEKATAFDTLLADLGTMAKAIDVNQERIEAGRKAEGHMQSGDELAKAEEAKKREKEEKEKKEREEAEKKKNEGKGGEMCKSFSMVAADGTTVQVQDATELLKSFDTRLTELDAGVKTTLETACVLLKSQGALLTTLTEQIEGQKETIGSQETLIKSLREDVNKLAAAPAGRKTTVALTERQATPSTAVLAKSGIPDGVTEDTFFAKAFEMQESGKITGAEISLAEAFRNSGKPIPPHLVNRVLGAGSVAA